MVGKVMVLLLAAAVLPPQADEPERLHGCSQAKTAHTRSFEKAEELRLKSSSDPLAGQTDVLHYRLDFEVDPAARYIDGNNTIRVRTLVDGVTAFRFWLHEVMSIAAVKIDGRSARWQRLDTEIVEVSLGRSLARGEEFELEVDYQGSPPTIGVMSIIFEKQQGTPVVSTLSQPWFSYTWWPVKEDSRDKATGELLITVPKALTVVSNGNLVGVDTLGGGKQRFHWSTEYPMSPYLFAFSATRYNTFADTFVHSGGSMPVEFFIYPGSDTTSNRSRWRLSMDMLATFSDLYGPYPFIDEKYAIYEFPWGGGMEHQTASGQGGFDEHLTAHELAHQWWGDMVTCATWSDIWLNEGFATYSEALWYEHKSGTSNPSALKLAMNYRRPRRLDGTVYVHDPSSILRIFSYDNSYQKGAWVLHMLRGVMGDDPFFTVLDVYRDRFEYLTASTEDFREVAEEVWGEDLRWFFDLWVYGGGAPAYRYGWREHEIDGQRYLEVSLRQTQNEPAFEMPVTIETIESGESQKYRIWNDEGSEHFLIPVSARVDEVLLDPEDWILTRSKIAEAFTEGPPRVVAVDLARGSVLGTDLTLSIGIRFHKDVIVDRSHFALRRANGSEMEFEVAYDVATFTAILVSRERLGSGRFELTIDDSIVDSAAGLALDGELSAASGRTQFPSGDGMAGGDAVIEFAVAGNRRPATRVKPAIPGTSKVRIGE